MSRTRLTKSILVSAVGILLGWVITQPLFTAWRASLDIAYPAPTTSSTPVPLVAYTTYVVLWLDDYTKPTPLVEALWLAFVPSDYSQIQLLNLSTGPFRDQYSNEFGCVPLALFQSQLRGAFGGAITLDRSNLSTLIDQLGGIYVAGQKMDGAAGVNYLTTVPPGSTDEVLIRQQAVMQGLVAQFALVNQEVNLLALLQIPRKKTADDEQLLGLLNHYYPFQTDSVQVGPNPHSAAP